jgi:LDH2 family malate/lactate/ureidoglycolate dehydrogenase
MKYMLVDSKKLRDLCQNLFEAAGVPKDEAFRNADNLNDADLKGISSHGATRMAVYLKRLRLGLVRPDVKLDILKEAPGSALIDANNSMGAAASYKVMQIAIDKAKNTGISFITVRNSNHFSAAAYYAQLAATEDMIGFVGSNGPARVAPWGGREAMFGTSPFAFAIPAGTCLPIVADMATSLVARGKIILAAKKGESIPLGWARDKNGRDTTDAQAALDGTVLPFAGPKGYSISTVIEVLTGILSGSMFTTGINDLNADFKHPSYTSHYFGAINIACFQDIDEFKNRMDEFILSVKASPKGKGVKEIFLPGEIELRKKQTSLKQGIHLADVTIQELKQACKELNVKFEL